MQIREGANGCDHAILLEHRAVIDLLPAMAVERARDDIFPANDRGGNDAAPLSILSARDRQNFLLGESAIDLVLQERR